MTAEQTRKAALAKSLEAQARAKRENAKHTPGPWESAPPCPNGWRTIFSGDTEVATAWVSPDLDVISDQNCKSNARLIAAAPEMLEALRNICDEQDAQQGYASLAAYDQARAAIAKATGDTP